MTIIKTSNDNMTTKDLYDMTMSPTIGKMSAIVEDAALYVKCYVLREDVNSNGEPVRILTIMDDDGNVYGTNSHTFIEDFLNILTLCEATGDKLTSVSVRHATSKNGRSFIQCVFVD